MHEASIAMAIIEQLEDYERQNNVKIDKVVIEVGAGSGVNLDALNFCLGELKKQMQVRFDFQLIEKPLIAMCLSCNSRLKLDYPTYLCPKCKETAINILEGLEFNIVELEVSDNEG